MSEVKEGEIVSHKETSDRLETDIVMEVDPKSICTEITSSASDNEEMVNRQ